MPIRAPPHLLVFLGLLLVLGKALKLAGISGKALLIRIGFSKKNPAFSYSLVLQKKNLSLIISSLITTC